MEYFRKRRYVCTNTSSEDADPGTMCSIEFFMAGKDAYRQLNGDRNPVPWPYFLEETSDAVREIVAKWKPNIQRILQEHNIEHGPVSIESIISHPTALGDNRAKPTLIINTRFENFGDWRGAATEIYHLMQHDADGVGEDIQVEIRNPFLMYRDMSMAVRQGMPCYDAFKALAPRVEEAVLDFCPRDNISTISYEMRGSDKGDECRPTVVIRVRPGKRFWWLTAESKVEEVLRAGEREFPGVVITVDFIVGECIRASVPDQFFWPVGYESLNTAPENGTSISARLTPNHVGTVGTWLWYTPKGESKRQRVILTCYHVIRSGNGNDNTLEARKIRKDYDENGIALRGTPIKLPILTDCPAGIDAAYTLELFGKCAPGTFPAEAHTRRLIEKYTTGLGFGRVLHASGRRQTHDQRTLDWAIVGLNPSARGEFDDNIPQNRPPFHQFISPELKFDNVYYHASPAEVITKVGVLLDNRGHEAWALKVGRTTGSTTGELSDLATWAEWRDEEDGTPRQHTKELAITGFPQARRDLAKLGDSGSMVLNSKKEFVGMIIGTNWDGSRAYMTPANDIFKDIEAQTGGKISL